MTPMGLLQWQLLPLQQLLFWSLFIAAISSTSGAFAFLRYDNAGGIRKTAPTFSMSPPLPQHCIPTRTTFVSTTSLCMVRNVDLPEALVFYGAHVFMDEHGKYRDGVERLLDECRDIHTPVVVLLYENQSFQSSNDDFLTNDKYKDVLHIMSPSTPPPNPRALYEALQSITMRPRGFGGSSGFGRRQWEEPERPPLPQHAVVLCDDSEAVRAARFVGTRVMCLKHDSPLADAVVDSWEEIWSLEDIGTPGSFWLNPPHPKDDEGNRIDVEQVMEWYEQREDVNAETGNDSDYKGEEEEGMAPPSAMTDNEMSRILADLDSL